MGYLGSGGLAVDSLESQIRMWEIAFSTHSSALHSWLHHFFF